MKQLEAFLSNSSLADVEREDLTKFNDSDLIKLLKFAQLNSKGRANIRNEQRVRTKVQTLTSQIWQLHSLIISQEHANRSSPEARRLREEIQNKKKLIAAYQNAIKTHKKSHQRSTNLRKQLLLHFPHLIYHRIAVYQPKRS